MSLVAIAMLAAIGVSCGRVQEMRSVERVFEEKEALPDQNQIRDWERRMRDRQFGRLNLSAADLNVYTLIDAINLRLAEDGGGYFVSFCEPSQINAGWSLIPLEELVNGKKHFAERFKGADLVKVFESKTLWEAYNDILLGGFGLKSHFRRYGVVLVSE